MIPSISLSLSSHAITFGCAFSVIVLVEIKKLIKLWKYGILHSEQEQKCKRTEFIRKVACLIAFALLEILETIWKDGFTWTLPLLISSVMLPLAMTMTYFNFRSKLSVNQNNSWGSTLIQAMALLVGSVIKFGSKLSLKNDDLDANVANFLLRILLVTILAYEPSPFTPPATEDTAKTQTLPEGILPTLAIYYRLRKYILPSSQRGLVFIMLFFVVTILTVFCAFHRRIYSMNIVNSLQFHPEITNFTGGSSILDRLGSARLEFRWDYIVIYYVLKFLHMSTLWIIKYYLQMQIDTESAIKIQMAIFSKLQKLSLRWHLENQASEVFVLMSTSPGIVHDITNTICELIPDALNTAVSVVYLARSYPSKLSSIVVFSGILSALIDVFVIRRRKTKLTEMKKSESKARTSRSATFENYETMKYFTTEDYEQMKYRNAYIEQQKKRMDHMVFGQIFRTVRDFSRVGAELIVITLVVQAVLVGDEGLTAGDYLYFSGVFSTILWPVDSFMSFYKRLQEKAVDAVKIGEVLDLLPEITDDPDARELEIDESGGSIEFRNVSFGYVPERQVIKDFCFTIPAGHTVAFVGRSGSGKSTLTKLLFRLYDTTEGEILVNGQNIRKVKSNSLRNSISVVQQEIVLFADTIKYNIQYGKMDTSDEEIEHASRTACIHERISAFPDKYKTEVGSRGLKLSGGEKQRVGIARAVLRNTPILLLDEATSSLDTETEKQIQSSLENLYQNRTTIIIAHRLSTIINVNTIIVLDEGRIVEFGSHDQLLARDCVYASMWHQQFSDSGSAADQSSDVETASKDVLKNWKNRSPLHCS